jgi:hypothetical protein
MLPMPYCAIFENGVLKPLIPLNIPEHKKITLTIKEEAEEPSEILSLKFSPLPPGYMIVYHRKILRMWKK